MMGALRILVVGSGSTIRPPPGELASAVMVPSISASLRMRAARSRRLDPLYLSFIFGFIRDMWNPFGMRDRGFMLLFGGISALLYVGFAFAPIAYGTLLCAVIL